MTVKYIRRKDSYDIPYVSEIRGGEDRILITAHGFASSKQSPNVNMLMSRLPEKGIGVIAFDFPAHGDSPAGGDMLTVDNCTADLKAVADFVAEGHPEAEICYFGSSFGAYIIMLYMMKYQINGARAFLRSAAVDMHEFFKDLDAGQQKEMDENGYIMLEYDDVPDLKLTREFIEDLKNHNLFTLFEKGENMLRMIHGSSDEDVDYENARAFSEKYDIELITVEGGDHRLSIPGAPERVLSETLRFLG